MLQHVLPGRRCALIARYSRLVHVRRKFVTILLPGKRIRKTAYRRLRQNIRVRFVLYDLFDVALVEPWKTDVEKVLYRILVVFDSCRRADSQFVIPVHVMYDMAVIHVIHAVPVIRLRLVKTVCSLVVAEKRAWLTVGNKR